MGKGRLQQLMLFCKKGLPDLWVLMPLLPCIGLDYFGLGLLDYKQSLFQRWVL